MRNLLRKVHVQVIILATLVIGTVAAVIITMAINYGTVCHIGF